MNDSISILDAGADPSGIKPSTEIIQSCIDSAGKTGQTVVFPEGRYLSGGLILRSGITLHFLRGSELAGIPDVNAYPQKTVWQKNGSRLPHRALLLGENLENVTLLGPGTINGQGELFSGTGETDSKFLRPMVLNIRNSRRVRVENLHLKNSAIWMQSYELCQDLQIRGLHVDNVCSHCNDGMDIVSCKDVTITDCRLIADDDGLCFKTFEDEACERIVVDNCSISSHCNAIKIGTESRGDFRNISVSNCAVTPPENPHVFWGHKDGQSGILISSMDGAHVSDIRFKNISIEGTRAPIYVRLGNRGRILGNSQRAKSPGSIRGIRFHDIRVRNGGSMGLEFTAVPGTRIEDIELSDFDFEFVGGGPAEPAWAAPYPVPEVSPAEYPNPGIHGFPPSWGLFARRIDGLRLSRGNFNYGTLEERPPIVADEVDDLHLEAVTFPHEIKVPVVHVPQGINRPVPVFSPSINPRLLARYQR